MGPGTSSKEPDSTERPALELRDLTFAYSRTPILEHVNLTLPAGESACFVGPNGGGKTTLFRLMLGLLKPDKGTVRVLGAVPEAARTDIGYVPQHIEFDASFPIRVGDVVHMGCLGRRPRIGTRHGYEHPRVLDALRAVNLEQIERQWFRDLSDGQRQRVLIARALATQPRLLLLDEPTASVDAVAEQAILELVEELRERMPVYIITHDASVVSRFLDTIVCVNRHVHIHPRTESVDAELMRHIVGYPIGESAGRK